MGREVKPHRVQVRRVKGWRMPRNTIYVGRGTKWGNPWRIERVGRAEAVRRFAAIARDIYSRADLDELRGKNLACWCKLCDVCHADVLLKMANK
jgi:uncharacterized protein DUF4326